MKIIYLASILDEINPTSVLVSSLATKTSPYSIPITYSARLNTPKILTFITGYDVLYINNANADQFSGFKTSIDSNSLTNYGYNLVIEWSGDMTLNSL